MSKLPFTKLGEGQETLAHQTSSDKFEYVSTSIITLLTSLISLAALAYMVMSKFNQIGVVIDREYSYYPTSSDF